MKNIVRSLIIVIVSILLASWGGSGHYIISSGIAKFFNDEMQTFSNWVGYIADHASDADYRKNDDPLEGPRHYIDLDGYFDFIRTGEISMSLEENIDKYGENFVEENGYLPWATIDTYNSLVENLKKRNWDSAKFFAADLGHYVADGHMPLHLTVNFDGQFTGNHGIHSRYETQMVKSFSSKINYEGQEIQEIDSVDKYIFNYLYENYVYIDSVLLADDSAKLVDPNTGSYEYTATLWELTGDFTILLFRNASHALTELLYTAWIEAGKPDLTGLNLSNPRDDHLTIFPNPSNRISQIEYSLHSFSVVSLILISADGKISDILLHDSKPPGKYRFHLNTEAYPEGVYFLNMRTQTHNISKKLLVLE